MATFALPRPIRTVKTGFAFRNGTTTYVVERFLRGTSMVA